MAKERLGLDGDVEKQCEHCRYFAPQGGDSVVGECRRHAPAPSSIRERRRVDDDTVGLSGWWPTVEDSDWCGEFEGIDGENW